MRVMVLGAGKAACAFEGSGSQISTARAAAEFAAGSGAPRPHDFADFQGYDDDSIEAIDYVCQRRSEGTWKRAR